MSDDQQQKTRFFGEFGTITLDASMKDDFHRLASNVLDELGFGINVMGLNGTYSFSEKGHFLDYEAHHADFSFNHLPGQKVTCSFEESNDFRNYLTIEGVIASPNEGEKYKITVNQNK